MLNSSKQNRTFETTGIQKGVKFGCIKFSLFLTDCCEMCFRKVFSEAFSFFDKNSNGATVTKF